MPTCLTKQNFLFIRILNIFVTIALLYFFGGITSYAQCDMGTAYSYTDTWVEGEEADPNGDGIVEVYASNPPQAYAVGRGVVENSYNTCGHEYYTNVTVTGPDGSSMTGIDSASLEIILDGDYFAESELLFYCPIAGREFEGGTSYSLLDAKTNEIYYGFTGEQFAGNTKHCVYRACVDTDRNPPNGCFFNEHRIIITSPDSRPCPPGAYTKFVRTKPPFLGFPNVCIAVIAKDLTFNPCPFGTL